MVLRYLGELCLALIGIALVPALFALLSGELAFALRAALAAAVLTAAGLLLLRVPGPRDLQTNEALVTIAIGYLLTAVLMSWPLAEPGVAGIDAFFHSVSAVTTTGLSTLDPARGRTVSFLFTQAWMQWYGGLVIVVLAVFLVGPGAAAKRLSASELGEVDAIGGTRRQAVRILFIYGGLTMLAFAVLLLLGAGWFDALAHALSAVSTGGFSSLPEGLRGLGGWPLQAAVLLFALAGAVSFSWYQRLIARRGEAGRGVRGWLDSEVLALVILCIFVAGLLGASMTLAGGRPWSEALRAAPLLAVSAQATAGFTPVEIASLDNASKLLLIASMLVGGDLGSTAGGLKIFRILLIARLVQLLLLRAALPPHAVARAELNGTPIEEKDIQNAIGIVALASVVVFLSWLAFLLGGHAPLDALFEVASATGTVGLSSGVAAPDLAPALKGVLCLDMWMGRLEILAVLVLFYPRTWLGRRAEGS